MRRNAEDEAHRAGSRGAPSWNGDGDMLINNSGPVRLLLNRYRADARRFTSRSTRRGQSAGSRACVDVPRDGGAISWRVRRHLIQQAESLAYVKEQLGHSSIQVTVDIYGHLIPGANRAAVDKLDVLPARIPDASNYATAENGQ